MNFQIICAALCVAAATITAAENDIPPAPKFSLENMDQSVDPAADFYQFAAGGWLKRTEIPADKSRWTGFEELRQRNWLLIRGILEDCAADTRAAKSSPRGEVGIFYRS